MNTYISIKTLRLAYKLQQVSLEFTDHRMEKNRLSPVVTKQIFTMVFYSLY